MLPDEAEKEMVLARIQKDKACTENQLTESLPIDKPAVRMALAQLVLDGKIIWVGALPKSGVFFKPIEEKGFGFTLRRASGATDPVVRINAEKVEEIYDFTVGTGSVRVTDVVERFPDISRVSAFRVLKALEKAGRLESMVWRDARQMGRPPRIWAEPGFLTDSMSNPTPEQMPQETGRDSAQVVDVVDDIDDLPILDEYDDDDLPDLEDA